MSSYTHSLYHTIFSTKRRQRTLSTNGREALFKYITGLLNNHQCHLYQINGVEDHIHIAHHLHPSVCLADLVKDIKVSSSKFIKSRNLFARFKGWQTGYSSFTYSMHSKHTLVRYIQNQEQHHKKLSYSEELTLICKEHGITFESK